MFRQHFSASCAPAALQRAVNVRDPSLALILWDINMPRMSGLEMLPQARAKRPEVPLIMITNGAVRPRRQEPAVER